MIEVRRVSSDADWAQFECLPSAIYADDPYWVPEVGIDHDGVLRNPTASARARLETESFIALEDGKALGRIAAIFDRRYVEYHREQTGFFGFYEAVRNDSVAGGLFGAVDEWAREKSLAHVVGPMNPSMLYSAGMLVHGHGRRPLVGMPHNPAYYAEQADRWGMHRVKDLHSFASEGFYAKIARVRRVWARRRTRLTFRNLDLDRYEQDVEHLRTIYNAAFSRFWGFTSATYAEFQALAESFKPILDPELVVFGELDGVPVAYLMGIPDVSEAWGAELPALEAPAAGAAPYRTARVDMLAVHPNCTESGAAALVTLELLRRIHEKGYTAIEAAPLLDDTSWWASIRIALFDPEPTRIYRIFGWDVGTPTRPISIGTCTRSG